MFKFPKVHVEFDERIEEEKIDEEDIRPESKYYLYLDMLQKIHELEEEGKERNKKV